MISSISNAIQTQPAALPAAVHQSAAQKTQQSPTTDTVQLSSNVAKAVLQETVETPAQTTKEASAGDVQAKRLLAKEAADKIR